MTRLHSNDSVDKIAAFLCDTVAFRLALLSGINEVTWGISNRGNRGSTFITSTVYAQSLSVGRNSASFNNDSNVLQKRRNGTRSQVAKRLLFVCECLATRRVKRWPSIVLQSVKERLCIKEGDTESRKRGRRRYSVVKGAQRRDAKDWVYKKQYIIRNAEK